MPQLKLSNAAAKTAMLLIAVSSVFANEKMHAGPVRDHIQTAISVVAGGYCAIAVMVAFVITLVFFTKAGQDKLPPQTSTEWEVKIPFSQLFVGAFFAIGNHPVVALAFVAVNLYGMLVIGPKTRQFKAANAAA